jgi:hypothetical protein
VPSTKGSLGVVAVTGWDWYDAAKSPRDQIVAYARAVLSEFAGTRVWAPAAQLRATSMHAAREYAGRFLLELLQNAHDTHPEERHDGRITIVVDGDEGAHGVVYVANGGNPFTHKSMSGLCKLALSPKPVGAGIGHKGVGFRSILPVCEWPEIYSADPVGPAGNLDGYTFRFARHDDVLAITDDEGLAARADSEFPPFQLPIPVEAIPGPVSALAAAGHVTVIRLPLATAEARIEALGQASALANSDVPVLLFLERISSLTVVRRDSDTVTETALSRSQEPLDGVTSPALSFSRVDLANLGVYTVASAPVAPARLLQAISAARHSNLMSAEWEDWDHAVVSIAVPADGEVTGRMYTFLPMGDKAPSPFAGHLNAPFFTKLDRTDIDPGHPLNDLLLDVAAESVLDATAAMRSSGIPAARRWISDLAGWDGPHRQRLAAAAERSGAGPLSERPFVPIEPNVEHPTGWASLAETYRWPAGDFKVLSAARAAAQGTCLLDGALSLARIARWEQVGAWLGCALTADDGTLAELLEQVIITLKRPAPYEDSSGALRIRRSKKRKSKPAERATRTDAVASDAALATLWADVYSDLAILFAPANAKALQGHQVLVDDAGDLRPANRPPPPPGERIAARRVSAFLPPARDQAPVAFPASLRQQLFYLHPLIAEQLDQPARALLVEGNLAYGYDIRNLLDHVGAVLGRTESGRVHRDALRFVFTLHQNDQIPARHPLAQLRLRVPTTAGTLVPAGRGAFGPGWDGRHGTELATVIEDAEGLDRTLAELGTRLVEPTPDLVRSTDIRSDWSEFLAKLGVIDGLPAYANRGAALKLLGWQLEGAALAERARVPDAVAEQWKAHLATQPPFTTRYPYTEYVVSRNPPWVVGQAVAEQLTDSARDAYARLILHGLTRWSADHLTVEWSRDRVGNKDPHAVPTPLAAFLATAAWLPAAPRSERPAFARPDELWHFSATADDATPSFAPLVNLATRVFLDAHPKVLAILQAAGLGIWSDPAHAARLVRDLGEAAGAGAVTDLQREHFLRAYLQAWSNVANRLEPGLGAVGDLALVLREGSRLSVRRVADLISGNVTVYLARPGDGLHLRLLHELELPVLLIDGNLEWARGHLAAGLGDLVRLVDETAITVTPSGVLEPGQLLINQLRWMAVLVAAAADHGRGLTLPESDFERLGLKLRRLRVRTYRTLGLSLFDQPTELPATRHGLFAQPDDADPTILAPGAIGSLTGPALVALAEEVAVAVGHADLRERLRAGVLELQRNGNDTPDPDDADLAQALRLSTAQVAATRSRLNGGLEALVGRLYPLLVHWAGRDAANAAADIARAGTGVAELVSGLASVANSLPVTIEALVGAARTAASVEELRVELNVDFAKFNLTLESLAPAYSPFSHLAEHEQALRQHVNLFRKSLSDRLRWARLAEFDAGKAQPDWPELRAFDWVTIPEEWGTTIDNATRDHLIELVDAALQVRLGAPAPTDGPSLSALDTLGAANTARVARAAPGIARLTRAWTTAHRVTLDEALWSDDPGTEITDLFDANGVLDFRDLTDDDIPAWLDVLGWWPDGMPATTDPETAGVTKEQLAAADSAATVARHQRERKRRLLPIGGKDIDVGVGASDLTELIDTLQGNLDANPAAITTGRGVADLLPVPAISSHGRSGGGGGGRDPMGRISDEQRQAIGFAGEWLAYQWLIRHYREANESSWMSMNRRGVFAGDPGDDSLGYDFRIELAGGSVMFEVKASRDAPGMFTLTDSEIREARAGARNGRWRLLVVPYISDPARCRVLRLPNPFEARAGGLFRPDSEGIRYRYNLCL